MSVVSPVVMRFCVRGPWLGRLPLGGRRIVGRRSGAERAGSGRRRQVLVEHFGGRAPAEGLS
ncbi:MAG: hypothetical protein LC777_02770, partial [Actinobacteria bacterium]|nr:hypothetical protein [Actinomycetota bacterium]